MSKGMSGGPQAAAAPVADPPAQVCAAPAPAGSRTGRRHGARGWRTAAQVMLCVGLGIACAAIDSRLTVGLEPDSCYFINTASHIAHGRGIVASVPMAGAPHLPAPNTTWPPLYSVTIAALMQGAGLSGAAAGVAVSMGSFLGTICLAWWIGWRIAGRATAMAMGLFSATCLYMYCLATWVGSDAQFLCLCTTVLLALAGARRPWQFAAAGLLAALSIYCRYIGIAWLGVFGLLAVRWYAGGDPRWRSACLAGTVTVLVLAPLLVRNTRLNGHLAGRDMDAAGIGIQPSTPGTLLENAEDYALGLVNAVLPRQQMLAAARVLPAGALPAAQAVLLAGLALGGAWLCRRSLRGDPAVQAAALLLVCYSVLLIALRTLYGRIDPLSAPRFSAPAWMALSVILGGTIVGWLGRLYRRRKVLGGIACLLILGYWASLCGWRLAHSRGNWEYADAAPAVQWLQAHAAPGSVVGVGAGGIHIARHTDRYLLLDIPCPGKYPGQAAWDRQDLQRLRAEYGLRYLLFPPIRSAPGPARIQYLPGGYGPLVKDLLQDSSEGGRPPAQGDSLVVIDTDRAAGLTRPGTHGAAAEQREP